MKWIANCEVMTSVVGVCSNWDQKHIKRLLTVNTIYYLKPQKPNLKVIYYITFKLTFDL